MCAYTVKEAVKIPILSGEYIGTFVAFDGLGSNEEHIAIVLGPLNQEAPLVRLHSECLTGDVFGSHRCDCGAQLHEALERMAVEGGVLIYLRQEGRGIGLYAKLTAYRLQDDGMDTFEANRHLNFPDDCREFSVAAQILKALNITRCRLMTNNPDKVEALRKCGINIDDIIPTGVFITAHNERYLHAKAKKKNHTIDFSLPRESS